MKLHSLLLLAAVLALAVVPTVRAGGKGDSFDPDNLSLNAETDNIEDEANPDEGDDIDAHSLVDQGTSKVTAPDLHRAVSTVQQNQVGNNQDQLTTEQKFPDNTQGPAASGLDKTYMADCMNTYTQKKKKPNDVQKICEAKFKELQVTESAAYKGCIAKKGDNAVGRTYCKYETNEDIKIMEKHGIKDGGPNPTKQEDPVYNACIKTRGSQNGEKPCTKDHKDRLLKFHKAKARADARVSSASVGKTRQAALSTNKVALYNSRSAQQNQLLKNQQQLRQQQQNSAPGHQ